MCIRQQFKAQGSTLLSVDIFFATYKRKNPGAIHVEICDFRQRRIAGAVVNSGLLIDNAYREFGLNAKLVTGQSYELRVWTKNCRSGHCPTAAFGSKTSSLHFFFGKNLMRGAELTCRFNYDDVNTGQEQNVQLPLAQSTGERAPIPEFAVPGVVTVVVPHFKCEEYLPKCLASLAKQSYSCLEVIVVDDGSDDQEAVRALVETFKPMFACLHFIGLPKNGGAPAARNAGATMASGEYLYFCDADVDLYPDALENLVRCLIEVPGADFAYGGFQWGGRRIPPMPFDEADLRKKNYITTMSMLRRAKFPGWDERLKRHQDWDLWLTMVDNGSTGVCCGKYLFETPRRQGSISTDTNQPLNESVQIVKQKHGLE